MHPRTTLSIAIAAGLAIPATGQEVMSISYSWLEVVANTTVPVASPNSVVEPGEGARIRLGVTALINGANAVGQTIVYTNPAPGGLGTVRGLGTARYDLFGDSGAATANGVWASLQAPSNPPFTNGNTAGTVQPGGASILGLGGTQFIGPGGSANTANNNQQVFRGVWTPSAYSARTVRFVVRGSTTVASDRHSSILLAYGYASGITDTDPFTYDLLTIKYIDGDFGSGVDIAVIPAPPAYLALGLLLATARSRASRRGGDTRP